MTRTKDIRPAFNKAPDLYDKVRPTYPEEFFDLLFEALPNEPDI